MMRLADDRFRVVTGAFDGGRDEFWIRKHLPTDGSVQSREPSLGVVDDRSLGTEGRRTCCPV